MLHSRLLQLGATAFCPRGEGNEQHPEGYNAGLRAWTPSLSQALVDQYPLTDGETILAEDAFIEPEWQLVRSVNDQGECTAPSPASREVPDASLVPTEHTHIATVRGNPRITPPEHDQDVRLLDLIVPGHHHYQPGAVAVVYPKNFPADVQLFIGLMGWEDVADVPLQFGSSRGQGAPNQSSASPLKGVGLESYGTALSLRTLLTNHLDIMSIPRRYFFCSLANFAKDSTQTEQYEKERLLELGNPELIDELWDYTTRPRRTILEVMQDFTTIKIPWRYAVSVLPIMRGRQFSIASGGEQKSTLSATDDTQHTRVELLIAIANPPSPIIKYRKRYGVCTRYITTLETGQQLRISIQPGYLNLKKDHEQSPAILIGPGTGVAPLRSLIYERLAKLARSAAADPSALLARTTLFFGCRRASADHFFADEWQHLAQRYGLVTHTAYSREPGQPRTYVQDKIREQGQHVYNAIVNGNGMVFVCGSSGNMPKGVRQALVDILVQNGEAVDEAWAEQYLESMEKQGRYKQETW